MRLKRYALIGAGNRGFGMFAKPLVDAFPETTRLAAVCDANPVRAAFCVSQLGVSVPTYTDFAVMMREARPDGLIVATRDCTHAEYVIAGLKAGKRVYSEKPLCTTAAQCRAILRAARQGTGRCFVTHNLRYTPALEQIRRLFRDGTLGTVSSMQFDETLDRSHGADYFRRWHREKANSGGLLIHKASHHFDILNWWADAVPVEVRAQGRLAFYGHNGRFRGARCMGCAQSGRCEFHADMFARNLHRGMYLEAEHADGYIRDGCVFDPKIDIQDQMGVLIRYANGIEATYTLHAFSPYESMRCVIEGSKGRLEYTKTYPSGDVVGGHLLPGGVQRETERMRVFLPGKGIEDIPLVQMEGGHGGADPRLRAEFFGQDWRRKPSDRMASLEEAVQAVMVGVAANHAMATGKTIDVQRLLGGGARARVSGASD